MGGGSSTFAGLDDVSFSDIQNGQVPKYNSTTQKWENANESGGGHTYSTTEQVVGTWIDGKPVYQTTYEVDLVQSGKSWVNTGIVISDIKSIISVAVNGIDRGMNNCPASTTALLNRYNNSNLQVYITEQWYLTIQNIIVRYTKTTD